MFQTTNQHTKWMSKDLTAQWLGEFSRSPKSDSISMAEILTIIRKSNFNFDWCPGACYDFQFLCLHEGPKDAHGMYKGESAIVLNQSITKASDIYKAVFNEKLVDKINKLSAYASPDPFDILAIGFPLSNKLEEFVDRMYMKFEADRQHVMLIEYGCSASNFKTVLDKHIKNERKMTPSDCPLHFLAHPLLSTCLLLRKDQDQKHALNDPSFLVFHSRDYVAILWCAKQYPIWQKAVIEKMLFAKALLTENGRDVSYRISAFLLIKIARQPIKEVTAFLSAESKARKRIQPGDRPVGAKRQKVD